MNQKPLLLSHNLRNETKQEEWVDCRNHAIATDLSEDGFAWRTMDTIEVKDNSNYRRSLKRFQNCTQIIPSFYTDLKEYTTFKRGHNSEIDREDNPSYTLSKNWRNTMSFVGLRLNKETGIVTAFADSKSTVKKNGEIVGTENIDKILDLGNMILVFFGQTTSFSRNGDSLGVKEEILRTANNGMLNEALLWEIRDSFYHCSDEGHLGILFVAKNCKFIGKIWITAYELTTSYQYVDDSVQLVYGGDSFYIEEFNKIAEQTKTFPKDTLKKEFEKLIEKRDQMQEYNPVGGPVHILEWSIF